MRPSLTENDWNFPKGRVPDEELIPCLLWEFLRESVTVRDIARDWAAWIALGKAAPDQTPLSLRTQQIRPVINAPFTDTFIHSVCAQCFGFAKWFDQPWQSLSEKTRRNLTDSNRTNPALFVGYGLHATGFVQAMREKRAESSDPLVQARAMLPESFGDQEAVLLVIDWGRYDDAKIRAEFSTLVDALPRPEGIKPTVQSGSGLQNPNEWRGKLNSLGMARIYARYDATQLSATHPSVYRAVAKGLSDDGPVSVAKKLRAARKRFEESFATLLPFESKPPLCITSSRLTRP